MRNLIESAKSDTGAEDTFERIKALINQFKESEEKRPRL